MGLNKTDLNQIGKIVKDQQQEYQRYLKMLSEDFNSKLKIVGEGIRGILESSQAIYEMVAKNTEDITIMQADIKIMKGDVKKNTEDIEVIKGDVSFIKNELKQKVDRDEFVALEKRVIFLENKLKRV